MVVAMTVPAPLLRMRHAFMKLTWRENDISLLAGQTWDLISPEMLQPCHCGGLAILAFADPRFDGKQTSFNDSSLHLAAAITGNTGDGANLGSRPQQYTSSVSRQNRVVSERHVQHRQQ